MSDLIIPNQAPKPQPGIQFEVAADGPAVMVRITATAIMSPEQASGLADAIAKTAVTAKGFGVAIVAPMNGRKGLAT